MEALATRIKNLPTTFWFVPAVLIFVGLVLGEVIVAIDRSNLPSLLPDALAGLLFASGPSGASAMVTTVGTAVFGVAGTAFSITMSVIATASSTYGPRLVRNFMADRGNQLVLGMFGATFVYCLMVLRRIRTGDDGLISESFVPQLAVNFTLLLAVADVALLIYFIHHIATSIEVSTLTGSVRNDLTRAIDRLFPTERDDRATWRTDVPLNSRRVIESEKAGFVAQIYGVSLRSAAEECGSPVVVLVRPGDHVLPGTPLAYCDDMRASEPDSLTKSIVKNIELQPARTPYQDIRFCLSRVAEMAVRALSPGTNDPYTAVNAIRELATALVDLAGRPEPWEGVLNDPDDELPILIIPQISAVTLTEQVFNEIRPYVGAAPMAIIAVADLGAALMRTGKVDIQDAVRQQLAALTEQVEEQDSFPAVDRERLLARIGAAIS